MRISETVVISAANTPEHHHSHTVVKQEEHHSDILDNSHNWLTSQEDTASPRRRNHRSPARSNRTASSPERRTNPAQEIAGLPHRRCTRPPSGSDSESIKNAT